MNCNGAFRFHKVGQGLFYSGILNGGAGKSNPTFSFVYDCGSESSKVFRDREIDDYKALLPYRKALGGKALDLLVISHLHDDHVNGLDHLLKGVKVDTVVMPYTCDKLLLLAQLESQNDEEFLQDFYADPINWFVERGVQRIVLLGADRREGERRRAGEDMEAETGDRFSTRIRPDGILGIEVVDGTQVVYYKHELNMLCRDFFWMFQFENLELDRENLNKYIQTMEAYKQSKGQELINVLGNKQLRNELKEEIKGACGNMLNRTSVVMEHGPTKVHLAHIVCNPLKCICGGEVVCQEACVSCMHEWPMTILTGDMELEDQEEMELLRADPCKRCLVLQYPHHGSRNNDISKFIQRFPYVIVLSYGITNRYGHPDAIPLRSLGNTAHVNERKSFDYQIFIE